MRPQLILDCGGRVFSALLVTADDQLAPCSQEIRQVATRHVSNDILFESRVVEDRDFIWEDALETLARSNAASFFQRARRIGLRRPWDQASADALQLTSPFSLLSAPTALADRTIGAQLPRVALTLLDALFEPAFAFVAERGLAPHDVDLAIVIPAQAGRGPRLVLQKLARRRGFLRVLLVQREIAAAMALAAQAPSACVVVETSETDLHLHRVVVEGDSTRPRFRTAASVTLPNLGWNHWSGRIAEALGATPSAAFERSLTSFLTGSPDSLPQRVTHDALHGSLDGQWIAAHALSLETSLSALGGQGLPLIFTGELFTIDAVRNALGAAQVRAPQLDQELRNVASVLRSPFALANGGSLRVNTFHGETIELLPHAQLPASGESCHVETNLRLTGERATGKTFLMHLQWGVDRVAEGNATLCAVPVVLRDGDEIHLAVHLRRRGNRLHGTLEVRMSRDAVVARARFAEQLEEVR